jgi:hypothetical protein
MKKSIFAVILLALFIFNSCKKENLQKEYVLEDMLEVIEQSGYNIKDVEVKENYFLIEGDMRVDFKSIPQLKSTLGKFNSPSKLKAYHYGNPYYATRSAVQSIRLFVSPTITDAGWISAINTAVSAWNSISSCPVQIYFVSNATEANITINSFYENSTTVAYGYLPIAGNVGSGVSINTNYNYYSVSYKINVIAHEIGHNLGFAHSNGTAPNGVSSALISGTSSADNSNAVMYPYTHEWKGFSSDEILASQRLFRPLSIIGPTDLTYSTLKPNMWFSYYVDFGSYGYSNECIWSVRYGGLESQEMLETTTGVSFYTYYTGIKDGQTNIMYLDVYCPSIYQSASIQISVKDGYLLFPQSGALR